MATQVNAILDVVATLSVPSSTAVSVAPAPAPISMIGTPTVATFAIVKDLVNEQVQFSYLVYQTYNAAGGVTGMADVTGTSAWISTPGISDSFPSVSLSGVTATSAITGGSVIYTIAANVNYNRVAPAIYSVTTEP